MIKKVDTLQEFIEKYDDQVVYIIKKTYRLVHVYHDIDDVKQHLYLNFLKQKTIEKYKNNKGASFSTYIYRCIQNFLRSYYIHNYPKKHSFLTNCLSLNANNPEDFDHLDLTDTQLDLALSLDLHKFKDYLLRYPEKGSRLPLIDLYRHLAIGDTPTDFHKKYNITIMGVCRRKDKLREVLTKYLGHSNQHIQADHSYQHSQQF